MNTDVLVESWRRWDARHGDQEIAALVMAETALGMPFGLPHHHVHDVLVAWKRAGLSHHESVVAFQAGARTLMP